MPRESTLDMIRKGMTNSVNMWVSERFSDIVEAELADYRTQERLRLQVAREWGVMRAELRVKQAELFGEFDRYQSEGALRLAIAPPLTALAIVLASRDHSAWLLILIAVVVAIRQARNQYYAGLDVLATALRLRIIHSPVMERFETDFSAALRGDEEIAPPVQPRVGDPDDPAVESRAPEASSH
jgi:hypothetical protein